MNGLSYLKPGAVVGLPLRSCGHHNIKVHGVSSGGVVKLAELADSTGERQLS